MRWIEWHVDLVEEDWITPLTELLVSRRRKAKSWRSAKKRECGGEKRQAFYSSPEFSCTSLVFSFTILFPKKAIYKDTLSTYGTA